MTSLVKSESVSVVDEIDSVLTIQPDINNFKNLQCRHALKCKENIYKHKYNKVLKRKLKKYKLRQDGREDPDVLDVSKTLVSALIIKSPNNSKETSKQGGDLSDLEDLQPINYLFKMGRRKESIRISKSLKDSNIESKQNVIIDVPIAITNQDKKQTNAFKLLMDSRNKSIGSNSPGKEKSEDVSEMKEEVEKKNLKVKRQLLLQKMAEAKGSIKNKEIEEYKEKIIQKKMEIRAEKLKNMILKDKKAVNENKDTNKINKLAKQPKRDVKQQIEVTNNNTLNKQTKSLKIVDIFNTIEESINVSPVKKYIPKEDQEFLKKLSPSLKKKESMLSYFKKLEKDFDCPEDDDSENDNLIKVKLQPRNKKRSKKKLSLKKVPLDFSSSELLEIKESTVDKDDNEIKDGNIKGNVMKPNTDACMNGHVPETVLLQSSSINNLELKSERQKRKRNFHVSNKVNDSEVDNILNNDSRPKRSVKRPVKYDNDACISSSDEELHIFTPRKKKHIESVVNDTDPVTLTSKVIYEPLKPNPEKRVVKETDSSKKPAKLAPIFTPKQTDLAALEAKQKFLQSGVPDKLKKVISQQKNSYTPDNSFPIVVHVQQTCVSSEDFKLIVSLRDINEEICTLNYEEDALKKLLHLNEVLHATNFDIYKRKSTQTMLQSIKQLHPKFPVYRTYRYLKSKGKGEFKDCNNVDFDNSIEIINDVVDVISDSPDRLNWTDKYKAMSTNQIIGNFDSIKELKRWLILWTENNLKSKPKTKAGTDSSDYYQSDTDSRDSMKGMNNLLVLTGPTGCGKTASVYAVAAELSMKVIEVNASSKRTGKIMLQDLQEATQSHKVNRASGNVDTSQKSQGKKLADLAKNIKKRGRPKKSADSEKTKKLSGKSEPLSGTMSSQESTRTDSSLILIDDADIVFEQDDGFSSAIVQLVHCSKRPVILITSSMACPHLQRFLQSGKILKMYPLLPRMLGTWLDIMCLADSGVCWPGVGAKFLSYFKGDIRKTINYLQFYIPIYVHGVATDEETATQNVEFYKTNNDEEGSCMSWAGNDDLEGKTIDTIISNNYNVDCESNAIWKEFIDKQSNLLTFSYSRQLINIWWSIPKLLTSGANIGNSVHKLNDKHNTKKNMYLELEAMANAIDAISLSDYITQKNPDLNSNITSQPWYNSEEHSVSERENMDYYNKGYEVTDEICRTLVTSSIIAAQNVLGCEQTMDLSYPEMSLHRERDKVVSRHKCLTSYLNASAVLDRRALALDYWPSCRTICRFEKSKNDTNMKRNNRFCHYLKSLSVLCKSDTFDNLCDSLNSNEGTTSFNE